MVPQELTDVLKKIDDDTTALAVVVASLRDSVKTSMTETEVNNFRTTLDAVEARLRATAADPNNPVPPGPQPAQVVARR